MASTPLSLITPHGIMDGHVSRPPGQGSWPAVILYMDAMGVRPALAGMAERLASSGYVVILPNLYYRHGPLPAVDTAAFAVPGPERERVMALMRSLTHALVMSDTKAVLEFLDRQADVTRGPLGVVGYCMGGGFALTAAGTYPERIGAAASFHGAALATDRPDSPHLLASRTRAALYVGVAGIDPMFSAAEEARLQAALADAGCRFTLETYVDVRHGFSVTGHPVYDEAASERHWRTLVDFFARELA